ncbi:putative heterokaryon incompatibility protein [Talaromyces proteolyticus]|uniref:Heterokaryon incompatibility protein n=1 Tax=Talaromyces proteolyticus TaxID=1131652 RepID=A0AAD4Q0P8_9EURO|nr:putative heterokaryon incompatibility protein [Talaromyces proteolyticus]KAH8697486.1 putative heterokaryon incompatibility protein [Talaromyces proteolyticus]
MDKNSDPVTTTEDARAVIEELARRKGTFTHAFRREAKEEAKNGRKGMLQAIEGSEEIREDLAKALKIISTDLYASRARFLMEVIQNADDNKYAEGETPTLSITVSPKHVKIECNEEGFSRENIQALCRTGRSSKRPGQGYTGEKGIGFKSVFKLANRAHIRSPPYYFQLDQTRELGMITPQWDEDYFDDHEEEHQTTIVLDRICDQKTDFSTALKKDVKAIDPVLILFLRRIERFHLTLFKSFSDDEPAISKSFRRLNWTPDSGIVSLKDEDANTMRHLYKHRFTTDIDGIETRRLGITETDIVLAFPVEKKSGTYIPSIRDQNLAFAYLPLGDFGFKFVIQADFLTTSNRQSVDEDNYWNKTIADAIPHAFEAAIDEFNNNGGNSDLDELAKMWPLYLSHNTSISSSYWRKIAKRINKRLSRAFVIKDRTGGVQVPKNLMFLDWTHDRNGKPMFGQMCDYVSPSYPESVREALLLLGVTAPDWKWLCDKLQELHDKNLLHIRMRSKEWCSDLAKVILEPQEPRGNRKYARDLRSFSLIPLADGTWRCPPSEDDPIYFPASLGTVIPPGLPLSLVDEEACACPKRSKLFRLLGVEDCDVPNVVKRILDYHAKFNSAMPDHLIAQLKYLYKMREHLLPGDMDKVYFACSASKHLQRGTSSYADISVDGELQQLFSGSSDANFLDGDYFAELDPFERAKLAEWLSETASVALAPRFISTFSHGLHRDFKWLLANKSDQVLAILRQHWSLYNKCMTKKAKDTLASHEFMCKSGDRAALRKTYIPFPKLVETTQVFGYADDCHFLVLPSGDPKDWKFLSSLGVGLDEGLDFYLWILNQSGFGDHIDVDKSKLLYLAIQSRAFSPIEQLKVKEAFGNHLVNLPNGKYECLESCVWQGPKGFSSKPALRPVYGHELDRLFREILEVPNATSAEVQEYLEQLGHDRSTTMADVTELYVFLQNHCADTFSVDDQTACIAVPSLPGSALEWKTPAQCVWDDEEFSQNELELESKTAIRRTVEQHAPTAKAFFTDVLKLPNAGIHELLADLSLMQKKKRDDPKRVHLLYERIESCRRRWPDTIRHVSTPSARQLADRFHRRAFRKSPLVFLRGVNDQSGRWLSLKDCIWTRSVLRYKHALMPSLNQYRDLFRDTLEVPNATMDMLVTDLLESLTDYPMEDEDGYQYVKELLQEIARLRQNNKELERLDDIECWPCHTPNCPRDLCSIGSFYVNDRQDLFDIFSDSYTFLDFDFDTSRRVADLLRNRGCDSFLSENVFIDTESCEPLEYDHDLTQDFRSRADALVKYFEYVKCESSYELRTLLENVAVWMSADIKTHYTLEGNTVTKSEGGSSVKVSLGEDETAKLEIFVSANKHARDCALITDIPEQLVAALELEPADLPDLHPLLRVPLASLKALLIKKGITGGDTADDSEETLVADSVNEDSLSQSDGSCHDSGDDASTMSASGVSSDSEGSAIVQCTRASARSEAANTTLRPHMHHRPSFRPTTPQLQSQYHLNLPSDESPRERPVTPRPTAAGLYSTDNRNRNRALIQGFALNADPASSSGRGRSSGQSGGGGSAIDMSTLREALEAAEPTLVSTPIQVNSNPRRWAGPIPNRNEEEMARDFEVGFLGEQFVYTLLHDTLELPDFTGKDNWTSSLRSRAGFSTFGREVSDFTYEDTQGSLTRHFLRMQHPYATPEWLSTACDNGNVPLYRLEVKSTTSQDPTTTFYMSGRQYELAKKLRVTSATPSEVYVVLRISGLDALEDGAGHRPQWRVYLDPYTLSEEGVLNFFAPTYAVRVTALNGFA